MQSTSRPILAGLAFLASLSAALAFPPAPRHTIFGMVRDSMGEPLIVTNATVILETAAGTRIRSTVKASPFEGVNYELAIPMDAGLTADAYKPTALRPTTPFRMKVLIGANTYYPMEIKANYANLGKPAQRTHLDLTLGEDTDGDGLPDAWERALAGMLGGNRTLADIRPEDDLDRDGLSNMQEYLAGTYAFDPSDGFDLTIVRFNATGPVLEFLALRGRTYTIMASPDLKQWTRMPFRVLDGSASPTTVTAFPATEVNRVQVEVVLPEDASPNLFFKAMVE